MGPERIGLKCCNMAVRHEENTQRPIVSGAICRSRPEIPTWFSGECRGYGTKRMVCKDN